jgi:hypothetical protein
LAKEALKSRFRDKASAPVSRSTSSALLDLGTGHYLHILPDAQSLANSLPGELTKLEAAYGLAA